jgi:hypothetical protein
MLRTTSPVDITQVWHLPLTLSYFLENRKCFCNLKCNIGSNCIFLPACHCYAGSKCSWKQGDWNCKGCLGKLCFSIIKLLVQSSHVKTFGALSIGSTSTTWCGGGRGGARCRPAISSCHYIGDFFPPPAWLREWFRWDVVALFDSRGTLIRIPTRGRSVYSDSTMHVIDLSESWPPSLLVAWNHRKILSKAYNF